MTRPLDGPRRDAPSGKATSLVIFLHGYGANGADLFSLAPAMAPILPDTAVAAPNAPAPCEMGGPGFQWFGLRGEHGAIVVREAGADEAAVPLMAFIEAELARYALDSSRLALVGFSQGTMMALHVGTRLSPAPAAIIGFSGLLVAPARLAAERRGSPPILLVHGTADQVVPFGMLEGAAAALRHAGLTVETLVRPGLGHGMDDAGLNAGAAFLKRHLAFG